MIKKYAWTMVELIVCITIIFIISYTLFNVVKPNMQKSRIFLYATISNLMKGNITIIDKYSKASGGELFYQDSSDAVNNTYCMQLADVFTLDAPAQCGKTLNKNATNLVLSNGVEIRGLTLAPITPTVADYSFKNILIDIDGFGTGLNKLWVDQFPLRIYSGGDFEGGVQTVDCSNPNESFKDSSGNITTAVKSVYCSGKTINYTKDTSALTYDIVYTEEIEGEETTDKPKKGRLYATNLSPLQADCEAYGGTGYYHANICIAAGYKIKPNCADDETCSICGKKANICPTGYNTEAACKAINGGHKHCVTIPHKPSGGISAVVESLVGDVNSL